MRVDALLALFLVACIGCQAREEFGDEELTLLKLSHRVQRPSSRSPQDSSTKHGAPVQPPSQKRQHGLVMAEQPAGGGVITRPNQGKAADKVTFAVMLKDFYGLDFTKSTIEADLILSAQWTDTRTKALVPKGSANITMPTDQAKGKEGVWTPDIEITNRDIKGQDIISSMLTIDTAGKVTKVERVHAVVKGSFSVTSFPFDEQTIPVQVASTSLMAQDLVLVPTTDKSSFGVEDGIFDGSEYIFKSTSMEAFEDADGALDKSRGQLSIVVRRNHVVVIQGLVLPAALIVSTSFLGFFIPVATPPFLMPRVATSFISFLSQVTLALRYDSMQPARGNASWLDVFEELCMGLVYAAVCLNILIVYTQYQLQVPDLPDKMDIEVRRGLIALSIIATTLMFLLTSPGMIFGLLCLIRLLLAGSFLGYIAVASNRIKKKIAEKKAEMERANAIVKGTSLPASAGGAAKN